MTDPRHTDWPKTIYVCPEHGVVWAGDHKICLEPHMDDEDTTCNQPLAPVQVQPVPEQNPEWGQQPKTTSRERWVPDQGAQERETTDGDRYENERVRRIDAEVQAEKAE